MTSHTDFMKLALREAKAAAELGEVPVGAVIVKDGQVISTAHNLRESGKNALAHAELIAINFACEHLGGWRLEGCTLYVTLEPCPMCMGAVINSRISTIVYGADDPKAGCCGTLADFTEIAFNHKPEIIKNIMLSECSTVLKDFFKTLRSRKLFEK